jgi:hypothetical protein
VDDHLERREPFRQDHLALADGLPPTGRRPFKLS